MQKQDHRTGNAARGLFQRLAEQHRATVRIEVDGEAVEALEGDTLLVALLTRGERVRRSEFGGEPRAGFCLMGACQDCWVWTVEGRRLRACSTPAAAGMRILTEPGPRSWLEIP
jgi:predicted molibdopterin-dependent oxidoreductase YjgC